MKDLLRKRLIEIKNNVNRDPSVGLCSNMVTANAYQQFYNLVEEILGYNIEIDGFWLHPLDSEGNYVKPLILIMETDEDPDQGQILTLEEYEEFKQGRERISYLAHFYSQEHEKCLGDLYIESIAAGTLGQARYKLIDDILALMEKDDESNS